MTKSFEEKLSELKPTAKAARLRQLLPPIERQLSAGVSIDAILQLLHEEGIELTKGTFKYYLYRFRKKQPANSGMVQAQPESEDSLSAPQDLYTTMHPDPRSQAANIAHYESIMKRKQKEQAK